MAGIRPRVFVQMEYERAAREYQASLPLEHYMENTDQARQREITLESLALVKPRRSDLWVFNELLVQYRQGRSRQIRQVVPDNMVVLHEGTLSPAGSYDVELQPARPFWVLEYVSPGSERKDYEESLHKYERELKVPYYLLFIPTVQEMTLYQLARGRYQAQTPDERGRCAIPELNLEIGIHDGWVRYWYKGELLPLPAQLLEQLDEVKRRLDLTRQQLDDALADNARLLARIAELEQQKGTKRNGNGSR
jgi:Uma2 family endonuclease